MKIHKGNQWSCLRKRAYPTREDAERDLAVLLARATPADRLALTVYVCDLCGNYHVGRKPGRNRGHRAKAAEVRGIRMGADRLPRRRAKT